MRDIHDKYTVDWLGDQLTDLGTEQDYLTQIENSKPKDIGLVEISVCEDQLELF